MDKPLALDEALVLIGNLARALSEADQNRQLVNQTLIQDAVRFLEVNGSDAPKFLDR
jgi:hypothetical protein